MRLLIAVHTYPPGSSGGAEQRAERTARHLAGKGHDVRVFSVHWRPRAEGPRGVVESVGGIGVHRCWLSGEDSQVFSESYDNSRVADALRASIDEWRPDLIHQFSGYLTGGAVGTVARESGIPLVVSLTDYWWLCHRVTLVRTVGGACQGPTPWSCALCAAQRRRRARWPSLVALRPVEWAWQMAEGVPGASAIAGIDEQRARVAHLRDVLRSARCLIAPSQFIADTYQRYGFGPGRLRVMRQGIDPPDRPRHPSATLRFGYLGQIKPHKGVDLLVDAWLRLTGDHSRSLVLCGSAAGEEPYREALARRTDRPDVRWLGELPRERVWGVLAELDVLVVPSRWAENSPNAILEAQAMGVPIVGAAIGGIPELVEHETNGLLFRADSVVDLTRQLQRILDGPDALERYRANAVRVGGVQEEIESLLEIYDGALQEGPRPLHEVIAGHRNAAAARE